MVTIKTIATVTEDGTITVKAPGFVSRGQHRAVLVLEESRLEEEAPVENRQGFLDLASFRKELGVPVHPGNTVVEMREEERS